MASPNLNIDTTELSNFDPSEIKIVIGVTGKVDSLVSAFLLQKQGFQCIAVAIMNWNDSKHGFNLDKTCSVNQLEKVKALCDKINIPFYAVDAQKEFKELVINQMVADRVAGLAHFPCIECHRTKMNILYEKMKKLGAHFLATGHYAKCYKNHSNQTFSIHSATDRASDQSVLLGHLPQELLRKLILPFAELQKPEVAKLAKKFHFNEGVEENSLECFGNRDEFADYVVQNVPVDFCGPGQILDYYTRVPLQEHQGIFRYKIGDGPAEQRSDKEEKVVVEMNHEENLILKGFIKDFHYDFFQLTEVHLTKDVDQGQAQVVFCRFGNSIERYQGEIQFKNNQSVVLQLSTKIPVKAAKEVVFLYNKEGSAAKLLGQGKILYCGKFVPVNRSLINAEVLRDENGVIIEQELSLSQIGFRF